MSTNQKTNPFGSPKSLEEAISQIACFRPPEGTEPLVHWRHIMRDFLAQKFGVALMKAHTAEQEALLEDLWFALTGEKNWGRNEQK